MSNIKRILVPTDFSEPADAALAYALDLARFFGAAVSLVHVFEDPTDQTLFSEQYIPVPPDLRDELLGTVRRRLEDRVHRAAGSDISFAVLVGPTAQGIIGGARDQEADLIVMGTHGRRGVEHLLLGSVAEQVIRTAPCPVITVRSSVTRRAEKAA